MLTRSPSPHLFLVVANLLRIDQLDFSFPVTNEFMLSGTFRKKFAIPILPEQFGMGGTVAVNFFWYIWVADQLPGQGGVAVVFLSLLALIFVWQGAGADWNRWLFLGRGCSLSLNSYWAYTGFRWVLKVQWGCTVGHKVLFLLLEISFERIYTVPIRCKHCVTSWWEVMLYLCLCFTFWRLTPLKDVCSFCLLCFFSGFCGFL